MNLPEAEKAYVSGPSVHRLLPRPSVRTLNTQTLFSEQFEMDRGWEGSRVSIVIPESGSLFVTTDGPTPAHHLRLHFIRYSAFLRFY